MASISPGGNYFSQIQQNLVKGPDAKTAENLRQTGGTAQAQRKSHVPSKGIGLEEGFSFSEAAHRSLQTAHQESIQGHEHELAQQAGLQELDPESNEAHELRVQRGHERDQEEKASLPQGYVSITSPQGVEQVLAPDQVEKLGTLDGGLQYGDSVKTLLGDIPKANLQAAERVLETQMKDVKATAKLKPVPEAQDAGRMQLKAVDFLVGPLEIREPGNDRCQPMSLEFPPTPE